MLNIPLYFAEKDREIEKLNRSGKIDELKLVLTETIKQSEKENQPSLVAYFTGQYIWMIEDDREEAINCFEKSVNLEADNIDLACNLAHAYFFAGKYSLAEKYYEQALKKNEHDKDSIYGLAVLNARKGHHDRAIELLSKISIDSIDIDKAFYYYINGVVASYIGNIHEEIEFYKESIEIDPNHVGCLAYLAESYVSIGDIDNAKIYLNKALEISKHDEELLRVHSLICGYTLKKKEDLDTGFNVSPRIEKRMGLDYLRGIILRIQGNRKIKDYKDKMLAAIYESEVEQQEYISGDSVFDDTKSLFFVLRKWNSFSPLIILNDEERHVGGGYFLWHKGVGTVIDPGYNFIENFAKAGGKPVDIHNIIITHAHNDHTNDLESILTLIYQYNKLMIQSDLPEKVKKIDLYMNVGSFMKYSGMLDLRGTNYINKIHVLNWDNAYVIANGLLLKVLPAYHDELITKNGYAVGLLFEVEVNSHTKKIVITSDTGLFPRSSDNSAVVDVNGEEIWRKYGFLNDVDLLVVHIGSVKKYEFERATLSDIHKIFYPNHLGILGVASVIKGLNPKLAVVSEFGIELKEYQTFIKKMLQGVVDEYSKEDSYSYTNVLLGDVPFVYRVDDHKILSVVADNFENPFEDANEMVECRWKRNDNYYYLPKEYFAGVDGFGTKIDEYKTKLAEKKGLYFKK